MDTIVMGGVPWQQALYASMRGEERLVGWAQPAQMFLSLVSQGYRVVCWGYALSYMAGLRRQHRLPCRVVSIGNVTLGGTGKTPLTLWMARWLQRQGWRVVVLSRGYGGYGAARTRVVSEGDGPVCAWSEVGDEPYLLAQELPGVPVLIGACRVLSGRVSAFLSASKATMSRSVEVMMPTSFRCSSTTGNELTRCRSISRVATPSVVSGVTDATFSVMKS